MLVLIDESGDPGFKLPKGSSLLFAAAMVIFRSNTDADHAGALISRLRARLRVHPEFKFSNSSFENRDAFFQAVEGCRFGVRAIVVRKEVIYSPHLRSKKDDFYRYFVRQMIKHDGSTLTDAKVVIDGSGDRAFRKDLNSYLSRESPAGAIKRVVFKDSRSDSLLQLADMCVGAIARSYRPNRPDAGRWRHMLRPKIDDVWEFK